MGGALHRQHSSAVLCNELCTPNPKAEGTGYVKITPISLSLTGFVVRFETDTGHLVMEPHPEKGVLGDFIVM